MESQEDSYQAGVEALTKVEHLLFGGSLRCWPNVKHCGHYLSFCLPCSAFLPFSLPLPLSLSLSSSLSSPSSPIPSPPLPSPPLPSPSHLSLLCQAALGKRRVLFVGITCGLSAPFVAGQLDHCLSNLGTFTPILVGFNPTSFARWGWYTWTLWGRG